MAGINHRTGSSQLEHHLRGQTPTLCLFQLGLANLHTSKLQEGFPIAGADPDRQEKAKSACMTHGWHCSTRRILLSLTHPWGDGCKLTEGRVR